MGVTPVVLVGCGGGVSAVLPCLPREGGFHLGEQAWLATALGSAALTGRPMILMQLEQGWLLGTRQGLCLAQRCQIAPEIKAAVDVDKAGPGHGGTSTGRGCLCGGQFLLDLFQLQRMQVISGVLRMRGGSKHQALVVLQGFQPVADIAA